MAKVASKKRTFHQQIGLNKFKEETREVLHLERGCVRH
jgi:hypothetical protein